MLEKVLIFIKILGFLFLIAPTVLTVTYCGFMQNPEMEVKVVLIPDLQTLLIYNVVLGILGGLFLEHKRALASIPAGTVFTVSSTIITFIYVSWRNTIFNFEFLFPIFLSAIPAFMALKFLLKRFIMKICKDNPKF